MGVDIDYIINILFWNSRYLFWSRSGGVWLVVVYRPRLALLCSSPKSISLVGGDIPRVSTEYTFYDKLKYLFQDQN